MSEAGGVNSFGAAPLVAVNEGEVGKSVVLVMIA